MSNCNNDRVTLYMKQNKEYIRCVRMKKECGFRIYLCKYHPDKVKRYIELYNKQHDTI